MTQEALAERSGLACDTIRRLERGGFSPTLTTLTKLCQGFGLRLSTLIEGLERDGGDELRELCDFLRTRSGRDQRMALRVVRTMFEDRGN